MNTTQTTATIAPFKPANWSTVPAVKLALRNANGCTTLANEILSAIDCANYPNAALSTLQAILAFYGTTDGLPLLKAKLEYLGVCLDSLNELGPYEYWRHFSL